MGVAAIHVARAAALATPRTLAASPRVLAPTAATSQPLHRAAEVLRVGTTHQVRWEFCCSAFSANEGSAPGRTSFTQRWSCAGLALPNAVGASPCAVNSGVLRTAAVS